MVPPEVVFKALGEVLRTWADESESKRGVLKVRVAVLTPSVLGTGTLEEPSLMIRADLVRSALTRVVANIREVEALPGSELVRVGPDHTSFAEVRVRVEDLIAVHLDPLVAVAGRGLGADGLRWAEQSLAQATIQLRAAEDRVNAVQTALREYSGTAALPVPASNGQRPQSSSDVPSLTPVIDRTFIDRIVELTAVNTTFRQELTRSIVRAKVAAIDDESKAEYYRELVAALKGGVVSSLSPADVEQRLKTIVADSRENVRQFDALYDEYSRVALRAGPSMYRMESPPFAVNLRSFTLRSYGLLILAVLIVTPMIVALGSLVHHAVRQMIKRPARSPR
jgi:hypothetical protein